MRRLYISAALLRSVGVALSLVVAGGAVAGEARAQTQTVAEVVERIGRTRWTADNRVELLADPRRAWEARLDLLESARNHLFISTYSWHNDDFGKRFRFELAEVMAERRGDNGEFKVFCLADATAVGSFNRSFDALRSAGADVRSYHRSSWGLGPLYDARMHDKIMVADGRQAIVGGRNYSDIYFDPHRWWLDFGVLVEGGAVWDLQMIFLKSWEVSTDLARGHHITWPVEAIERRIRSLWATGRFPDGTSPIEKYFDERYFPAYESPPGETMVAVLYDNSIVWDRAPTADLLIELIKRAENEFDLMTPFPNFEDGLTDALIDAIQRGVQVRLIVNHREAAIRGGPILVAGFPTLIRLVEAGAEVWAWKANPKLLADVATTGCAPAIMPPIALHGKIVRMDDELTIVHSSNFNIRSTYYNTEAGVAVLDREFNTQIKELLDGLVTLSNFDLRCTNGDRQITVDRLVQFLGADEVETMREELGPWQRFLDGMGLLW